MQDRDTGIIFGSPLPEIIFYGTMAIIAAAMLIHYIRSERPVRTALLGMLSGTAALLLMHHFGGAAPFLPEIPLNGYTAYIALTLGIPGVAVMAVISFLQF